MHYQKEEKVYRIELTPVSFLQRSVSIFPDKVAIVTGDRQYTYREFAERINRLASHLRASGLHKDDRVAFLCPNTSPLLEAHFAVPTAGGVLVALNSRLNSQEIDYILKHSGARFLFVDAQLYPVVAPLLTGSQGAGIVLGAGVLVVLTSRADSPMAHYASCVLALLLAQSKRKPTAQVGRRSVPLTAPCRCG